MSDAKPESPHLTAAPRSEFVHRVPHHLVEQWMERLEKARLNASNVESLMKMKLELYMAEQDDDCKGLEWYGDFYRGALDMAAEACAHRAEGELAAAVDWLQLMYSEGEVTP